MEPNLIGLVRQDAEKHDVERSVDADSSWALHTYASAGLREVTLGPSHLNGGLRWARAVDDIPIGGGE